MKGELTPYLSANDIAEIVATLADKITRDYTPLVSEDSPLLTIVTLKGAAIFAADLVRELKLPITIDFIRAASYGSGTKSQGDVKILKDVETQPKNRHVLLLDEIVDSGHTMAFLLKRFRSAEPASLKICTLLNKPSRREVPVDVDYVGKDVEDKFLVGYGLDFNEKYRNLKEVAVIEN